MQQLTTVKALRECVQQWHQQGLRVVLVPTMGNLHAGHLKLVEQAKQLADRVVVSIFVNPTQFVEGEDFETYPRTIEEDIQQLEQFAPEIVFMPTTEEVYPGGTSQETVVTVPELDSIFCGEFRPGHFQGVATVVSKLLNMVQPDVAVFGQKDFQQLLVIKKLVTDLCFPVEIVGVETVREADGLAMSSRNRYLSPEERQVATSIYQALMHIRDEIQKGNRDYAELESAGMHILQEKGFKVDYLGIRNSKDLGEVAGNELVVLLAAWLGKARLIDNILIDL